MSITLATTWVRRGVSSHFPTKYSVDEAELSRISKLARLQLEDAQEDLDEAQREEEAKTNDDGEDDSSDVDLSDDAGVKTNGGVSSDTTTANGQKDEDDLKEYNLSDYDDDEADANAQKFSMFGNVRSLAYHAPDEEDPYLVMPEGEAESDDEREDLQILSTDNLILAAKVEDEVAHLEVFVYEDEVENLYVHHDIMLPAVPLCVEWLDVPVGKDAGKRPNGNFVAIGTMSPEIEIWDLDVVDSMYPDTILGQEPSTTTEPQPESDEESLSKKKKKKSSSKKKKTPKPNDEYHVDAVLALAANRNHRNLLASGSADKTIKLWDLSTGKCAKSYTMHSKHVCSLDWHPTESTILLSGSYDRSVIATDMRAPDAVAPKWIVESDVEKVRWDVHDPNFFYVATEAGMVHYFDARIQPLSHDKPSKPVWTLQAHDAACSAFDINPVVPGYIATGSDDKKVKLWNVADNKPTLVVARNFEVGKVFSTQFAPDAEVAFRLSVAGSRGQIQVWDTSTNAAIRRAFAGKAKLPEGDVKEKFVAVNAGGDDDSDDDDGGGVGTKGGRDGWESMDED